MLDFKTTELFKPVVNLCYFQFLSPKLYKTNYIDNTVIVNVYTDNSVILSIEFTKNSDNIVIFFLTFLLF